MAGIMFLVAFVASGWWPEWSGPIMRPLPHSGDADRSRGGALVQWHRRPRTFCTI